MSDTNARLQGSGLILPRGGSPGNVGAGENALILDSDATVKLLSPAGVKSPINFGYKPGAAELADADATITPGSDKASLYVMPAGRQTANRTITLSNSGAITGQVVDVVRAGTEAFTLAVNNAAAGLLLLIPVSTAVRVECAFSGAAWVLSIWYYI